MVRLAERPAFLKPPFSGGRRHEEPEIGLETLSGHHGGVGGPCGRRRRQAGVAQRHHDHGRRKHVRLAARFAVDACDRLGLRLHGAVQPGGLGRRYRGDHLAAGRFRSVRRAAHARSVQCLQRLRPDPVGTRRHCDSLQHPGASAPEEQQPAPIGSRDREDLHGPDHELERRRDQGAEPEGDDSGREDHSGLSHGQLGHDLQLHRLPDLGQR